MNNINALSKILNVSTLKFILLDIVTFGFYAPVILALKHRDFTEEMGAPLFPIDMLIKIIILSGGIDFALYAMDIFYILPDIDFSYLGGLIVLVCWIMFSFKMRDNLVAFIAYKYQFDVKANSFLLVIFNLYYVVYLINNLEKRYAFHQVLTGNANQPVVVSEEKSDTAE